MSVVALSLVSITAAMYIKLPTISISSLSGVIGYMVYYIYAYTHCFTFLLLRHLLWLANVFLIDRRTLASAKSKSGNTPNLPS